MYVYDVYSHITGTPEERGITAWQTVDEEAVSSGNYQEGFEVYKPWLPARVSNASFMTYIPFMPNPKKPIPERHLSVDLGRRKSLVHAIPTGRWFRFIHLTFTIV